MAEIKLDLSKEEEQGYYSLLAFSQLSIGEFCFYNKFEHKQGLEVLNSLKEKKLIIDIKGLTDRYIPQFPFLDIADKFRDPIQKFTELKTNLDSFFQAKEQEITKNQQEKIKEVNDAINPKISDLQSTDTALKTETDKRTTDLTAEMNTADENFVKSLGDNRIKSKSDFDAKKGEVVSQTTSKGSESEQKVLGDSKTLKDSTDKVITDFFTQTDESIYSEIIKSFDSLKTAIAALNTEITSYEKKFNDDSQNWIQTSQTKSETEVDTNKKALNSLVSKSQDDIKIEKSALNLLNLEFTETGKFENVELVKPFIDLRKVLEDSKTELNKVRDEFNSQITEIIQTDTKNTETTLDESKTTLGQIFNTILETRNQQGAEIASQLNQNQMENESKAQEFVKAQQETVTKKENDTKTAITTTKTDLEAKHSQAGEETVNQIENITSKVLPELESNVTNWNQNFKTTFETVSKTTSDQYAGITLTISEMMSQVKTQYEQNIKEMEQLFTKQNNELQKKFTALQEQVPPKEKDSLDSFAKVNTQVETELSNLQQMLETQINGMKTLLENHKQSILTDLPQKISTDLDTVSTTLSEQATALNSQLDTFLAEWTATTKSITDNWIGLEKKLRTDEESSLKNSNTELDSGLDELKKKASGLRVDLITNAKNQNKNLNETLNSTVDSAASNVSTSVDGLLTSFEANLTEFNANSEKLHTEQLATMKQTYDEIKSALTELLHSTRTSAEAKVQEQTSSVDQTSATAQNSYKESKEKLQTTANTNITQTFANIDEANQTYYKALVDLQNSFITEIETLLTSFETSLSDLTINQMKALLKSLQDKFTYFNETQQFLSGSISSFIEIESTVRQSLTQGIGEQAKLLQTNLKDHAGEFEKLVKVGEELLTPPSSLLDKFNGLVTDYAYPKIESSGIIGWSGSIVQAQNMIKSMKTRVTLLVPNPDDLADLMDTIQEAKRPKRVDISCQFDGNNREHVTLIKRLLNQDNITVRNIVEKMGTDSKYPPFLAVDRDGEEVMFGTQDPSNKTAFVGMVSQIEPFIQLMGKVVLSDFLSKAKKINQGDF